LIHFAARDKEAFLAGQAKRVALPDRMVTAVVVMGWQQHLSLAWQSLTCMLVMLWAVACVCMAADACLV